MAHQLGPGNAYKFIQEEIFPYAGDWSMFTGSEMKYASVGQGQVLPYLTDTNGSPQRVCWTLIKRADNGSVPRKN